MKALVYHGPGRRGWEKVPMAHLDAAERFITHRFDLDQFEEAYDVFANAAETGALKVALARR